MQSLISWVQELSQKIHLIYFVIIGSLVEEVVAIIPSPLVLLIAGSIAATQGETVFYLLWLSVIASGSKTAASLILYFIADKAEDVVVRKYGKYLGISENNLEEIGTYFSKGNRDDIMIFLLRALPIMPTGPVSVIAGLIKVNIKSYIVSTFLGLFVRNLLYLYLGYTSLDSIEALSQGFDSLEKVGYFILTVMAGTGFLWLYYTRQKGSTFFLLNSILKRIKRMVGKK